MPIYEYVCSSCKNKFEARRSYVEASEDAACPKCKGAGKRLISKFACASKGGDGSSLPIGGSGGGCGGCSGSSCSTCH